MINQQHKFPFCVYTGNDVTIKHAAHDFRLILTPALADISEQLQAGDFILTHQDSWQLYYVNYFLNCDRITRLHDLIIQHAIDLGLNAFLPLTKPLILTNVPDDGQPEAKFKKQFVEMMELKGTFNFGASVGIGTSNRGHFLYSESFGPCQAVFAQLHTGGWGLYHANSCVIDTELYKFANLIKDDVAALFIVQKTSNELNYDKASFLALNCHTVMPSTPIHVIQVEDYRNIVLTENQIVLGMRLHNEHEDQKSHQPTSPLTKLDVNQFKSLTHCVQEALGHDALDYEINKDGSIKTQSFVIKLPLLIDTVRQIEKKSGIKNNIVGSTPDFYQKPSTADPQKTAKKCMRFINQHHSNAQKKRPSRANPCNLM